MEVKETVWGDAFYPNFVYNHFPDDGGSFVVYQCNDETKIYYLSVHFLSEDRAEIGLWLNPIPVKVLQILIRKLFRENKKLKTISYKNSYYPLGQCTKRNHFRIYMPKTTMELEDRLSSKGKYNIRREKRILEKDFGRYTITEYEVGNAPDNVLNTYYELKKVTHHIDYDFPPSEYMERHQVSHIYVLRLGSAEKVAAMILSCEQCSIVYLENLTYDTAYSRYSLGQILYDIYLMRLIEKGKTEIFLGGGDYDYKRRYASVEEETYNGTIFRSSFTKTYELYISNYLMKIWLMIPYEKRQAIKKLLRKKG